MGPSHSGKSTLMRCLAGLDTVSAGRVWLGDTEITGLREREPTRLRRDRIGRPSTIAGGPSSWSPMTRAPPRRS
ncbi:hypothetical protein GCM10010129_34240 [Streptomyces fumigatiscleroticus]|nr:hypothetical protein GCM10010129_34240 [Streptomyces fumigatiscleroticus]